MGPIPSTFLLIDGLISDPKSVFHFITKPRYIFGIAFINILSSKLDF